MRSALAERYLHWCMIARSLPTAVLRIGDRLAQSPLESWREQVEVHAKAGGLVGRSCQSSTAVPHHFMNASAKYPPSWWKPQQFARRAVGIGLSKSVEVQSANLRWAEKARIRDQELETLSKFEKMALDIERAARLRSLAEAFASLSLSAGLKVDASTRDGARCRDLRILFGAVPADEVRPDPILATRGRRKEAVDSACTVGLRFNG